MKTTRNINEVPQKKQLNSSKTNTNWFFYFKEGGVKHYIDEIDGTVFSVRNSKTGQRKIEWPSRLAESRFADTYFFSNN